MKITLHDYIRKCILTGCTSEKLLKYLVFRSVCTTFAPQFNNLHNEKNCIIDFPAVHWCDDDGTDALRKGTAESE